MALNNVIVRQEDQHSSGLFTAALIRKGFIQAEISPNVLTLFSVSFYPTFFFGQMEFKHDLNPKTRMHLIDYWNGDMNRSYKMPCVVGGKGAQREEVFSIINLSPQTFVLCSRKQPWWLLVLMPSKISCTVLTTFITLRQWKIVTPTDYKLGRFCWKTHVQISFWDVAFGETL